MQNSAAARSTHPRGVFRLPFPTAAGASWLVAIDHLGRCVADMRVPPTGDLRAEWDALDATLERLDPTGARPRLQLID